MAANTSVDRLYAEAISIIAFLGTNEPSLSTAAQDNFRKALILAAASYFEYKLTECIVHFVEETTNGSPLITGFLKNKAISRQYHTWFKWDDQNANQFFGLFGADFRREMVRRVKESEELNTSIIAFLEIGNERNKLIHQDFASFPLEKTLDEIYSLYQRAASFIEIISYSLSECESLIRASR